MSLPTPSSPHDFQLLMEQAAQGSPGTAEALLPIVYDELHRIARNYMRNERVDHTLQTTALVNEAYLSLAGGSKVEMEFTCPDHFLAVAAKAMRHVLVNHAVARKAKKRTAKTEAIRSDALTECFQQRCVDLIALDESLQQLREIDPTQAEIVELRFFGGLTVQQCANMLNVSQRTVHYEWAHARAWLRRQLEDT